MTRLLIHVEGETEETFVNEVLAPHFYGKGFHSVGARIVGNARLRTKRGGIRGWDSVRQDILRHLRHDVSAFATLMVDYYALPATGTRAWPGRAAAKLLPFDRKAETIETALHADISAAMGGGFPRVRFVPHIVMHEFEGLLFSDCQAMANGMGRPHLAGEFQAIRDGFESPEHINDSPITAPSKRIEGLLPGYQKPLLGTLAALEIGMPAMRANCPLFDRWLTKLEELAV